MSLPCVFTTPPCALFSFCHPPSLCLTTITRYMEISVWHVEEEIARRWLIVSVISTCGHDYMLMYLHFTCGPVCCMLLQRFKGSGQSVMCFLIDKTVILSKMWPLGLKEEQSPYCLMSHSKSSFMVNAAGYPTEMLHMQCAVSSRPKHQQEKRRECQYRKSDLQFLIMSTWQPTPGGKQITYCMFL